MIRFHGILFCVGMVLSFCGCANPDPLQCENFYPELPDNEYCFRKIKAHYEYVSNPANQREQAIISGGKTRIMKTVVPATSPEAYLGILQGRGAVQSITVILTKTQTRNLYRNALQTMPDCLVDVHGIPSLANARDYFDYQDETHLRAMTFYYETKKEQEFLKWLRHHLPAKDLPRIPMTRL